MSVQKASIDLNTEGSPAAQPAGAQPGFDNVLQNIQHLSNENQDIELAQKSARDRNMEKELQREYKLRFYNDLHEQMDKRIDLINN